MLDAMPDGEYEVCIDSTLAPGSLTYGEVVVPGTLDAEILISSHVCHPSLADDNLSGIAVSARTGARAARGSRPTPHAPVPVRARHDRCDHVACPQ